MKKTQKIVAIFSVTLLMCGISACFETEKKDPCPVIKETVRIYEKKITSLINEKGELEKELWRKDSAITELKKKTSFSLKETSESYRYLKNGYRIPPTYGEDNDKIYIATGSF